MFELLKQQDVGVSRRGSCGVRFVLLTRDRSRDGSGLQGFARDLRLEAEG
jgi:hypothetical protein